MVALVAVVYFRPELLGIQKWTKYIWVTSGVLILPAVYFVLARRIFPKAFSDRIRIRTFTALDDKTNYNTSALARMLELEMQPAVPSKEARSRVGTQPDVLPIKISLAGATVPLDFIWKRIDQWILGPIYVIEGIISESHDGITIEAWCTERSYRWRANSSSYPKSDPLKTAILSLADQIKASFGHNQDLATNYEAQHRYGSAIYYCQKLDRDEQGTTLAYLYLNAGRVDEAELAFRAFESHENQEICWDRLARSFASESRNGPVFGSNFSA